MTYLSPKLQQQQPLVEQELHTLPEHMSSTLVLSGCWSIFSLLFIIVLLSFPFHHCLLYPSIYGYWASLWYLPIFLTNLHVCSFKWASDGCFTPSEYRTGPISLSHTSLYFILTIVTVLMGFIAAQVIPVTQSLTLD